MRKFVCFWLPAVVLPYLTFSQGINTGTHYLLSKGITQKTEHHQFMLVDSLTYMETSLSVSIVNDGNMRSSTKKKSASYSRKSSRRAAVNIHEHMAFTGTNKKNAPISFQNLLWPRPGNAHLQPSPIPALRVIIHF